jgi:septum formation protein
MIHTFLKGKKVVLASESPRRKKIFNMIGVHALQMPAHLDEPIEDIPPHKYVMKYARKKAETVYRNVDSDCMVIGADTIVYLDHKILGKPQDINQAANYLSHLAGQRHDVYTGICIAYKNQYYVDYEKTSVEFMPMSMFEIEEYIKTSEPMDKAGAYGIQGYGGQFIKKVNGCYFNVMGFPVTCFHNLLKHIFNQ